MSAGFTKKIGMTRLFIEGKAIPVTVLELQDNLILQKKTVEKDGYSAVQIGAVPKRQVTKASAGHVKKYQEDIENGLRLISEFDVSFDDDKKIIEIADFAEGELLDIRGTTIGRGFTGAVKRWGFAGQPASHGHNFVRAVGSIGARWPQRVVKGKKMAGHHGSQGLTLKKVKIVAIDVDQKLIFVNGSMPGANSSYLEIIKVTKKSR